jgi:hypothetical protein
MPAHDPATQAWIDAKPAERPAPRPVDDATVAGAAAAIEDARHRDDVLSDAMTPQLGLDLGIVHDRAPAVKLTDRFVVPPFSTLDSRQDYWKARKRAWLGLGIQSELGREGTLTYQTDTVLDPDFYRKKEEAEAALGHRLTLDEFRRDHYRGLDAPPASIQNTGTSIFDPVLCEVAYRWFSPPHGLVVDPFAGGSVRGVVASILGRRYAGIELRPEQIAANRRRPRASSARTPPTTSAGIHRCRRGSRAARRTCAASCPTTRARRPDLHLPALRRPRGLLVGPAGPVDRAVPDVPRDARDRRWRSRSRS